VCSGIRDVPGPHSACSAWWTSCTQMEPSPAAEANPQSKRSERRPKSSFIACFAMYSVSSATAFAFVV